MLQYLKNEELERAFWLSIQASEVIELRTQLMEDDSRRIKYTEIESNYIKCVLFPLKQFPLYVICYLGNNKLSSNQEVSPSIALAHSLVTIAGSRSPTSSQTVTPSVPTPSWLFYWRPYDEIINYVQYFKENKTEGKRRNPLTESRIEFYASLGWTVLLSP